MADLKSLLLPEKVVSFDFPGCKGLTFELAFLSKEELVKIQKECTGKKLDQRTRAVQDYFDDDKFLELYVSKIIRGWAGFKIKYLKEMVLIDDSNVDDDEEIDYSDEQALMLMKTSTVLDNWISEQIGDLGKFTTPKSKKKSSSSKSTSSSTAKV
jgi:hypothetical protein